MFGKIVTLLTDSQPRIVFACTYKLLLFHLHTILRDCMHLDHLAICTNLHEPDHFDHTNTRFHL